MKSVIFGFYVKIAQGEALGYLLVGLSKFCMNKMHYLNKMIFLLNRTFKCIPF